MPVLDEVGRLLGGHKKLAGVQFIAVQHLFPTTSELLSSLSQNGLDPRKATVSGKNYSTNLDVLHRLRADGWNIPELSQTKLLTTNPDGTTREVSPLGGYLQQLFADVSALRENDPAAFARLKAPQFVILDEGGKLLQLLHEHFSELAHLCVCVEQTDRGVQVIDEMQSHGVQLQCPVVNVARSQAKKQSEAPMIGESVVHATMSALQQMHPGIRIEPKEAAVVGYGAVGKATADALRLRGFTVYVYDIDPQKMEQAKKDGCTPGPREETLKHAHVLYSCTGKTTITPDEFDALLPKNAILVNAASGNHELGMDKVDTGGNFLKPGERFDERGFRRDTWNGLDLNLGDLAGLDEMASCVVRGKDGAERLVVRSGYVVNMTDDIPPEYIQLTRSLLLAACLQAVDEAGKKGLVDLAPSTQDFIVSRTRKDLARQGHDLMKPDFRRLAHAET
jgi:S-adenosylhomocysteine hydrolase